ncbi:Predicted arabinose efflux permease, MFS family [Paramicrobacterium humi]|uniref:Predicted arabinose efflux permease, MFS family n=1 Tax=Paramicrobacterium humi TaxID=640635 RepID=A0A1H4J919_9MICO|nr:MFS transporter [Microbacterium humi]SEB42072.1 Predicted arabinose efflux permease, MFS family [Microbacterium humi]
MDEKSAEAAGGILNRTYRWVTLGSTALVFLAAFESLAVTTVMPVVSADLRGESLYALAFAGPLATGVIGMVGVGNWADRRGPVTPLYAAVLAFVIGLLVAGTATTMPVFVAGRLVQGLGGGGLTVALYVVIARVYPGALHPKIFAAFAAAWVVPSLVGPVVAGAVAELFSWHWVFLGVVGLIVIALLMVVPSLRRIERTRDDSVRWSVSRFAWASLAALAVLGLNLLGKLPGVGWSLALACCGVAFVSVRPLVPRGTLAAVRGVPSVIGMRGLASAAFFGAEVYVPYLLTREYGFSPSLAGLALTCAALSWSGASAVQGRLGARVAHPVFTRVGSALVIVATAGACATALLHLPAAVVIVGWAIGGAGMGFAYPRLSVMVLEFSTPKNQGFNSSAMSIADSLGGAMSLALTGIVFAAFSSNVASFGAVFALTVLVALGAMLVAPRVAASAPGTGQPTREVQ